MAPRLLQPLFKHPAQAAAHKASPELTEIIRAYDVIWTLLREPYDITPKQREANAQIVLAALGSIIEDYCGVDVFDFDPKQLTLDLENQPHTEAPNKE